MKVINEIVTSKSLNQGTFGSTLKWSPKKSPLFSWGEGPTKVTPALGNCFWGCRGAEMHHIIKAANPEIQQLLLKSWNTVDGNQKSGKLTSWGW